ncbi:hypothetical protein [Haloglomus litoreum]|uniref:hypothetical protein n=1 Tax=Haloglomus litoreum TaxID=3034026 RepID=UPI0023E88615|nr:hypothetical protein [Haloglomus sp. DT116]
MIHGSFDERETRSAVEQDAAERTLDRDWTLLEALMETKQLGLLVFMLVLIGVLVYAGARMAATGDPLVGVGLAGASLVGGGLLLDSVLCVQTPAHVHECRKCRRETDRWRGPTRDDQWVTSLVGQPSAADRTPSATRYEREAEPRAWAGEAEPAVRKLSKPRSVAADPPSSVDGGQPRPSSGGAGD